MKQKMTCLIPQPNRSYEIEIHKGLLNDLSEISKDCKDLGSKCAIISDSSVAKLYGEAFTNKLIESGVDTTLFSFPKGEVFKTRQTKEMLEDQMFEKGFGRDSVVIALGGGVTCDLAGFLAATYCRGLPLLMVPTTLLAMVDASVGGKNGVNVPNGKNLVGSIYQPKKVWIDPDFLFTLPGKEYKNGLVEMIKHGLVADVDYFNFLEAHAKEIYEQGPILEKTILDSCRIKKGLVEKDEGDLGMRNLLNFGHTIGHAIEHVTNYKIPHGEAVSIGIALESHLSVLLGHLSFDSFDRIFSILKSYDLPAQLPDICIESLLNAMALDKKTKTGKPHFVLLREVGHPVKEEFCQPIERHLIKEAIESAGFLLQKI